MGTSSSQIELPIPYTVKNTSNSQITVSTGDKVVTIGPGYTWSQTIDRLVTLPIIVTITTPAGTFYPDFARNITYIVDDRGVSLKLSLDDLANYYVQGTGGRYFIDNRSSKATVNIDDGNIQKVLSKGQYDSRQLGLPGSNWVNVAFNGPAKPVAIFDGMTMVFPEDGTPGYAILYYLAKPLAATFPTGKSINAAVAAPGVAAPGVAAPGVAAPGVAAPGVDTSVYRCANESREVKSVGNSWWIWLLIIILIILLIAMLYKYGKGNVYSFTV